MVADDLAREGVGCSMEFDRDVALDTGWYPAEVEEIGCFVDPATGGLRGELYEAPHYTTSLDAAEYTQLTEDRDG